MINIFRSIIFVLWIYGSLIVIGLIGLPILLMPRRFSHYIQCCWIANVKWSLKWICAITTELRGQEHLPKGRALVALKHQSMYDTLFPILIFDDPIYVLKRELLIYPIFGWYVAKSKMIAIDRSGATKALKQLMHKAKICVERGGQVLIFPEGTRQLPGAEPNYKPGIAALYNVLDIPCTPIALNTGLCWPARGIWRKPGHIIFEVLPPIQPGLKRADFMRELEDKLENATHRLIAESKAT